MGIRTFIDGVQRPAGRTVVLLLGLAALTGCAGAAVEGARATAAEVTISNNMAAAQAGDAKAQYEVGAAHCCSLNEGGGGLYNTPKAVSWLCRSAAQGYAPAMRKLGQIYMGDTIEGVRLQRRLAAAVVGSSTNFAVSYAWLQQAAARGESEAREEAQEVWGKMNATQRKEATRLQGLGLNATCRWEEAIRG